jgi:hypothetical protein
MTTYKVKPEMRTEFEGYQKQISAALKKSGAPLRGVFRVWSGDVNEYQVYTMPPAKLADMEGATPLEKAMGKKASDAMNASLARCLVSQTRAFIRTVPAAEIGKAGGTGWFMQVRVALNPDRVEPFLDLLAKELKPAFEKDGVPWLGVARATFGEPNTTVYYVRQMKGGLGDIDSGPVLTRALGRQGADALNNKMNGMVRGRTTTILRYMDDLSFNAAPAATN